MHVQSKTLDRYQGDGPRQAEQQESGEEPKGCVGEVVGCGGGVYEVARVPLSPPRHLFSPAQKLLKRRQRQGGATSPSPVKGNGPTEYMGGEENGMNMGNVYDAPVQNGLDLEALAAEPMPAPAPPAPPAAPEPMIVREGLGGWVGGRAGWAESGGGGRCAGGGGWAESGGGGWLRRERVVV